MNCEKRDLIKISAALFFCYVLLAWLFPYTGDDWAWGSSVGMDRLQSFFQNYNGRYIGNLAVIVLTRSKLLDAVFMAASFCLICYFSYAYTNDKTKAALLLAASLYFAMPKDMWAQVSVWTAGFTNYVPSALISLIFLVSSKEITGMELSDGNDTLKDSIWMLIMGFCGALFVESITVFNLCLAVAVIAYMFLKFRRYRRKHFAFLIGSVLGTFAMFSNGVYDTIAQGEDHYRHTPVGLRDTVYFAVEQAGNILEYIIFDNLGFCVVVTVFLLLLAGYSLKKGIRRKSALLPAIFHLCSLMLLFYKDVVCEILSDGFALKQLFADCIPIAIVMLYVLSILCMVLCFVERGRRFSMLLPLYCAVVSLAPLLVVDPIGQRCVFIGYLLMIVFTADLFSYICKKLQFEEKWLTGIFGILVTAQFLFYFYIFYPIHYYDTLRLDYIKKQAAEGKKEVFICDLPNSDYLWVPTPGSEKLVDRYKLFYGLDEELSFGQMSYEVLDALIDDDV